MDNISSAQERSSKEPLEHTLLLCSRYLMCLRPRCRIPSMGTGRSQQMPYSCSHPPHSSLAVAPGMLFHLIYPECSMQPTSNCSSRVASKISIFPFFPWGLPSVSDFHPKVQTQEAPSWQMGFIHCVGGCRVSRLEDVSVTKIKGGWKTQIRAGRLYV